MLHRLDDYTIHQTSRPLLHVATDSANAYDRAFYNGYTEAGSFFAMALGVYPNRGVMDAAFSVLMDGVQHNVRASRACSIDRTRTTVEPITLTVDEPMRRHRVEVVDRFGLSAELAWEAISPAVEEPPFRHDRGTRTVIDLTRFTQFGRWTGWIEVDGTRLDVDGAVGCRDRSWGIRPVGGQPPGPASPPQFFWIWAPTVFDDCCTHLALNQDADGRPWHQSGAVVERLGPDDDPVDIARVEGATSASVDVTWTPGTRWAATVTTTLGRWQAAPIVVAYEPIVRFQMSGIGYLHGEWGHGVWRGDADATRDRIALDGVDPTDPSMIHVQALCRARWGDRQGLGVVEQLAIGPHTPSGLHGVVDGCR